RAAAASSAACAEHHNQGDGEHPTGLCACHAGDPTLGEMAQAPALPSGFELPLKQRLPRIGSVDQVAVEMRADELAKRSIKRESKVWALELAIRCCDLTTLEGQDTPGKVAALCAKAFRPDPARPGGPSVARV